MHIGRAIAEDTRKVREKCRCAKSGEATPKAPVRNRASNYSVFARTPKTRPFARASSTALSFELATSFITFVILATLFVARMRNLTAGQRVQGVACG